MATFTGTQSNDLKSVRAPANLPLWKNVVFSAAGGVVGECHGFLREQPEDEVHDKRRSVRGRCRGIECGAG